MPSRTRRKEKQLVVAASRARVVVPNAAAGRLGAHHLQVPEWQRRTPSLGWFPRPVLQQSFGSHETLVVDLEFLHVGVMLGLPPYNPAKPFPHCGLWTFGVFIISTFWGLVFWFGLKGTGAGGDEIVQVSDGFLDFFKVIIACSFGSFDVEDSVAEGFCVGDFGLDAGD